jgi:peptidyl-dipeptidase Dcp
MTLPSITHATLALPNFPQISAQQWGQALAEALEQAEASTQRIAGNRQAPTFDNVLGDLERQTRALSEVVSPFRCAQGAHNTPEMQELAETWLPRLDAIQTDLFQNQALYDRLQAVVHKEELTDVQRRLVERYERAFKHAGVHLPAAEQAELKAMSQRLVELSVEFQNACQNDTAETVLFENARALEGADKTFIAEALAAAEAQGKPGQVAVALDGASVPVVLSQVTNRQTRQIVYEANRARGTGVRGSNTFPLIEETLRLRRRTAELLGAATWADLAIGEKMAKTPATAERLVMDTWHALSAARATQLAELQAYADAEGLMDSLKAWDLDFYLERVRAAKFALDESQLKPYFSNATVRQGAFKAAEKLFGLTFQPIDYAAWHPDAVSYEVRDAQGVRGVLVVDDYVRDTKGPGAWMDVVHEQNLLDDAHLPVIINVCNVAKPAGDTPALLSYDDVITAFHELGHGLHGLLSKVEYISQAGTSVDRDFVELPSQLFENWARHPEGLRSFARHWQTGEALPEELMGQLQAAMQFGQVFTQSRYLLSALLDLRLHQQADGVDPVAFTQAIVDELGAGDAFTPRHELSHFTHLFAGDYSAGYYSYLWAEVLEANAFVPFRDSPNGIFDAELGRRLDATIFSRGDSVDPNEAFEAFCGHAPDIAPALQKWGVAPPAKRGLKPR